MFGQFTDIDERVSSTAEYIVETKTTVRGAAKHFGVSKSTVHKDMTVRLKLLNVSLFEQVDAILQKNKNERHIRGGNATRIKYLEQKRIFKD